MSATKTKKPTRKAKTTKKATKAALKSIEANLEAIDGAEGRKAAKEPKAKKVSALDAAAQVLAAAKEPMNTRQMIEAMAAKGLWTSPGGKTPHATLYAAMLREIKTKGTDARFVKTERGKFSTTH